MADGSAAWQYLLSKSPALAEGFAKEQDDYRERLKRLEIELEGVYDIRHGLDTLEKAGVDRREALHLLAIELAGKHNRRWISALRKRNRNLKNLTRRIRSLAVEIDRVYRDEMTHPDLWGVALQVVRDGPVVPTSERVPHQVLDGMLGCADDLEAKAAWFGEFLHDATPRLKGRPIVTLLGCVQHATGRASKHLQLLADIVAAAYDKYGIPKPPTSESLYKVLHRKVLPSSKR